jgi:hypothetical protein
MGWKDRERGNKGTRGRKDPDQGNMGLVWLIRSSLHTLEARTHG